MKDFEDLTPRGRILRLREVAGRALEAFGLPDAEYRFNHYSGNLSFRVRTKTRPPSTADDLFEPGQYVLRLHQDDYQETEAIRSELAWVEALRRDAYLPVPEPVRSIEGDLLVEIEHPGVPAPKRCTLLKWMRGRLTEKGIGPSHAAAMGRTMARMHDHASAWRPPAGFQRWRYTWDGLYGAVNVAGVEVEAALKEIPRGIWPLFDGATERLRDVMSGLGQGPDAFGLIHADFGLGSNILFWRGEARPIDFDDCAFGYWMFDIGVGLCDCRGRAGWPALRDAFYQGYTGVRAIPEEQWRHLELFIAAWHAFEIFWAAAAAVKYPAWRDSSERWMERAGGDLARVLASRDA